MRYRLRTLMIAMAIGPPILAFLWLFGAQLPAIVIDLCYLLLFLAALALAFSAAVSIPFVLAFLFSLIADALLYLGRHPDNRR